MLSAEPAGTKPIQSRREPDLAASVDEIVAMNFSVVLVFVTSMLVVSGGGGGGVVGDVTVKLSFPVESMFGFSIFSPESGVTVQVVCPSAIAGTARNRNPIKTLFI
jgi:hypothetical protein